LKPGGVLLLFLPDRRRTFDRDREPTSLAHLVDEFERGVTELDDAHLAEFIRSVPEDWGDGPPPKDDAERYARHRQRSIHVHCWTEDEFADVVAFTIEQQGMRWELVERLAVDDVENGIEFGLVLRKASVQVDPALAASRFRQTWTVLSTRTADARALREQIRANAQAVAPVLETAPDEVSSPPRGDRAGSAVARQMRSRLSRTGLVQRLRRTR
jgi:hypothetical protein